MNWTKILSIVGGISASLALVATIIAGYNTITTDEELMAAKKEIITEMRREVVRNRGVMISALQRTADDLLWDMQGLDQTSDLFKHLSEKHRQITREIEELKDENNP